MASDLPRERCYSFSESIGQTTAYVAASAFFTPSHTCTMSPAAQG